MIDEDLDELEKCNLRDDVGLYDQDLITMPTKDLNKMLKKKGISKGRQKQIKAERRTLKNRCNKHLNNLIIRTILFRGYAANCRVKREQETEDLQKEIDL